MGSNNENQEIKPIDISDPLTRKTNTCKSITNLLKFIGENPERDGLVDTPKRVVKAFEELTWGLRVKEDEFFDSIAKEFELAHDQMVAVRSIRFTSMCEHHLLPFIGSATVAYIPDAKNSGKVIGISKLARIVEYYAARPQIQERMTTQIADALETLMSPLGTGVWIDAVHTCMSIRGVKAVGASTVTSDLRGVMREHPETRSEFLALARNHMFEGI